MAEKLSKEELMQLMREIKQQENERAEKFRKYLERNGWNVSLDDAKTLLELTERFLENEGELM